MTLINFIRDNIVDFNGKIRTEEDLKVKVVIPYLRQLGYKESEMRFENPMEVVIGSKKTIVFSDIEIEINGKVELVIDVKKPSNSVSPKDILQAQSYAKLIDTPPALLSTITNGTDTISTNTFTGEQSPEIGRAHV